MITSVLWLAMGAGAADDSTRPQLEALRGEMAAVQRLAADVGAELSAARVEMGGERTARFQTWKAQRDELRREQTALVRERKRLDRERQNVERVTAYHLARRPLPSDARDPIPLTSNSRPVYARRPSSYATGPYFSYIQPYPFVF